MWLETPSKRLYPANPAFSWVRSKIKRLPFKPELIGSGEWGVTINHSNFQAIAD